MCNILLRENKHMHAKDKTRLYKDQLQQSASSKKIKSSRLIYSDNMRLLNTIQNARPSVESQRSGKIVRRPLYANKFKHSVERYMQTTKPEIAEHN